MPRIRKTLKRRIPTRRTRKVGGAATNGYTGTVDDYDDYPKELKLLEDIVTISNEGRLFELDSSGKNNPTKDVLDLIENTKKIKNLDYLLRDLSVRALNTQMKIWTKMSEDETKKGMFSTKQSSVISKILTAEQLRRDKEYDTYKDRSRADIQKYLEGDNMKEAYIYKGKSKEEDVFLKRAVRMFRHLDNLDTNLKLKFFAKIILCIIYKYHKDKNKKSYTNPFEKDFNIDHVDLSNLKRFRDSKTTGQESNLVKVLSDLQTTLSCSSHISTKKRMKICNITALGDLMLLKKKAAANAEKRTMTKADLDAIFLTQEEKTKLEDIRKKGNRTTDQQIVDQLVFILDIITGDTNKLKDSPTSMFSAFKFGQAKVKA